MLARSRPPHPLLRAVNKRFWPFNTQRIRLSMDERITQLRNCMYQYSRAIYRSIKDLIDPYVTEAERLEYRRDVLAHCEQTMERLAPHPPSLPEPDRAPFQ